VAFSFTADVSRPERRTFCGLLVSDLAPDPALLGFERLPIRAGRSNMSRWLNIVKINPQLVHAAFFMSDGRWIFEVEAIVKDIFLRVPNACNDDYNRSRSSAHAFIDYILIDIPTSLEGSSFATKTVYPDMVFPSDRQVAMALCPSLRRMYEIPGAQVHTPAVESAWEHIAPQFPQFTGGRNPLDAVSSLESMFGSMEL
jgi:hypothetical protein